MYFPYMTNELNCGNQPLEIAERQNIHSRVVALRVQVSLSQAAGHPEALHRRICGFSLSHDSETARIYAYCPEIEGDMISYYRCRVGQFYIWSLESMWTFYRFVMNVDDNFLPIHIR